MYRISLGQSNVYYTHTHEFLHLIPSYPATPQDSFNFPEAQTAFAGAERASGGRAQEPQAGGTSTSFGDGSASATASSSGSGSG